MFKQDIVDFDYGFHPKSILASNFRNVFEVMRRDSSEARVLV